MSATIATIQAALGGNPAELIFDGKFHRFNTPDSKRRSGWYVAKLLGGQPVVNFGDWRSGSKFTAFDDSVQVSGIQPTVDREREAHKQRYKAARAAETANLVWKSSDPADDHPYLVKKGIKAHGTRILKVSKAYPDWFIGWCAKYNLDGALIVPMWKGKELVDLQFITESAKKFLPNGDHKGARFVIGKPAEHPKLIVATGFATSTTIYECTGIPTICVFNDGNLDTALGTIKHLYRDKEIVIAADNDIHADSKILNSGLVYSSAASKKFDCAMALPEFNNLKIDYNDLFILAGKKAVIDSIQSAKKINPPIEISADKASELLKLAINDWLDWLDNLAIKGAAGLGKSTLVNQAILERGLKADYFGSSYKLGAEQVARLPIGAAISIRGRTHSADNMTPLCAKHEAAGALQKAGLAHLTMPLLCGKVTNQATGKRACPYSSNCGYLKQFQSTAPIRFYAHEYLTLDRTQLTNRDIDVAVIDESFRDSLEKNSFWSIADLMNQPESIYRELVTAIIENRLLSMNHLLDKLTEILEDESNSKIPIHPEMDSSQSAAKAKPLVDMKRKPTNFLRNCKQAIETNAISRFYISKRDPSKICASYRKPIKFIPQGTPTAYLDASLVDSIVKTLNPDVRIVNIEATRKAHITQITDSAMSHHRLMEDNDYLSSRLIELAYRKVKEHGVNGAVIAPKAWIEQHGHRLPESVKVAHFGALRGLNSLEQCDWLIQIGRIQPHIHDVEAVFRSWNPDKELPTVGNYLSQQKTLTTKQGHGAVARTWVHADSRCNEILTSMREQESLQGIDRLRLIHSKTVKNIYLLSNLPLPGLEPDEVTTLDQITLPGRMAEIALRDGMVITDRKLLAARHPDVFESADSALQTVRTHLEDQAVFNVLNPYKSSIGDQHIETSKTATYRLDGSRGGKSRTVIIPNGIQPESVSERLEKIHGKPVKFVEAAEPAPPVKREVIAIHSAGYRTNPADDVRAVVWRIYYDAGNSAIYRNPEQPNHSEAWRSVKARFPSTTDLELVG